MPDPSMGQRVLRAGRRLAADPRYVAELTSRVVEIVQRTSSDITHALSVSAGLQQAVVHARVRYLLGKATAHNALVRSRPQAAIPHFGGDALIVMLVVSSLRHDPRVERSARALVAGGWRVCVVAPDLSEPSYRERPFSWGPGISFEMLSSSASRFVETTWIFGSEMLEAAMKFSPAAFHCHDLNTALMGVAAAAHANCPCVVDFHEWSSENVSWNQHTKTWEPHSAEKRRFFKWAEKLVCNRAQKVITVNRSIARAIEDEFGLEQNAVAVVRNIPLLDAVPSRTYRPLKEELGISLDKFVVLYQGGTGPTRYLEPVIRALAYAPHVTLVVRGPSLDQFGAGYRELARSVGAEDRLILADAVPSADVVAAARGADVGIWTLQNLSRNFNLALPNKIFEYLAAGLPITVAGFPEAAAIAEGLQVGRTFNPDDPESIAASWRVPADEPDLWKRLAANVPAALSTLDAGREWEKLPELYASLLKRPRIASRAARLET